ncbi:MAG: hypothetical protein WAN35_15515 [Terracidiphilus sp.]
MKRCAVCNAVYSPNHAFCKVDGAALVDAPDAEAGVPPPAFLNWVQPPVKRRVPVWVWVLVGVGAFFLLIVPLLAILAIPTLDTAKKHANELSAIKSIQAIQMAESMVQQEYPVNGYACSLAALGGDPSAISAQLIQPDLASGVKNGYIFKIRTCTKVTIKGIDRITGYTITAVPQVVGKTGNRGFCADDTGIKSDPTGGTNCTQLVQ